MTTSKTNLALLGLVVGDCFGAPFEYHPEAPDLAVLSVREGRFLEPADVKVRPHRARLPGLYTDDTQQALALLATREQTRKADPRMAAAVFSGMMRKMAKAEVPGSKFGSHRGTGSNFRPAVGTGKPVPTAGLGAAMRVGPVATTFDDPQEMIEWVLAVSSVTTSDPVGLAVAAKFASVAWALAFPKSRHRIKTIKWPTDKVPPIVWEACNEAMLVMKNRGEMGLVRYGASTGWANKKMTCAANGFGLTGFAWAVYQALRAVSFEDALIRACASGGDTDTVAAMTGCLAALRFGEVPEPWASKVVGREHFDTWMPEYEAPLTRDEIQFQNRLFSATKKKRSKGKKPKQIDFFEMAMNEMEQEQEQERITALEPVLFGGRDDSDEFSCFSNFHICTFMLDGDLWRSSEHYYMAQKNPDDAEYQKAIRDALKPSKAKRLGRKVELRDGWDNMKYDFMFQAIKSKFEQNPDLARILLSTGDRPIHENRPDSWWGGGPNYPDGRDWLGMILMDVRDILRGSI